MLGKGYAEFVGKLNVTLFIQLKRSEDQVQDALVGLEYARGGGKSGRWTASSLGRFGFRKIRYIVGKRSLSTRKSSDSVCDAACRLVSFAKNPSIEKRELNV